MSTPTAAAPVLRFGRFELQAHERRLLADGQAVALGARAFDVLLALAAQPGRLVSKRALMDLVWPGLVVQENNLAAQVSALRKALGAGVVDTIPGRGYRFVARIDEAQAPAAHPRADTATALRTNLPAELPALLGRAYELDSLGALVDAHRLVSVVGAGGIGKSLLVRHLLHGRRAAYPQGVCWVDLATVTDADALPGAVATALGVDTGHGAPLPALLGAVAPLTMLLALDNAEHLLAQVAALSQSLHDAAAGLRLVVTSQAPLRLASERVFRVGPLAVPPTAVPIAQAMQFGAVALFVERAHAVDGRFALTQGNVSAVINLCHALDGLPLAIELTAARAPTLGLQRTLASLHDRLKLLTSSRNRVAPERQRTLRAALDWSYGLLQERERRVFRRLAVMAGSASLGLIQHVMASGDGAADLDDWAVLDALDGLIDRSLVSVLDGEGDGEPRYRLLESPRAYALERLTEAGERDAVQRRHAQALGQMFDAAYDDYFSGAVGADDWTRALEPDLDNAREALRWARAADDAPLELTIAVTLLRALPPSLHGERMALADSCEARLSAAVVDARLQQRTWMELSSAWADTQKLRGRAAAERALAIARTLDRAGSDRFVLYHALCRAASAAAQAGDLDSSHALVEEHGALEDRAWPAQRLLWGVEASQVLARMRGDAETGLRLSRRLVALDRERGGDALIPLGNLVDHQLAAGDAAGAVRSGAELVARLQGSRDEYGLAFARLNLCAAHLALDDCAQARSVAQAAWPQAVRFDLHHGAAVYVALLAALEGRPRAAARLLGYAQGLYAGRAGVCETNEAAAMQRAQAIALPALGKAQFDTLFGEGGTLREADVAAFGFGHEDA